MLSIKRLKHPYKEIGPIEGLSLYTSQLSVSWKLCIYIIAVEQSIRVTANLLKWCIDTSHRCDWFFIRVQTSQCGHHFLDFLSTFCIFYHTCLTAEQSLCHKAISDKLEAMVRLRIIPVLLCLSLRVFPSISISSQTSTIFIKSTSGTSGTPFMQIYTESKVSNVIIRLCWRSILPQHFLV